MAQLTVFDVDRSGLDVLSGTSAASGGGDTFTNTDRSFLTIFNGGGSSITVSFPLASTVEGQSVSRQVTIAAGAMKHIGPFRSDYFSNPSTGQVSITYSAVTGVTVKAFRLTQP